MDKAFSDMGESLFWVLTTSGEDDRICSEYGNYIIPLYQYLFSTLGIRLPFNAFEVGIFNYLMVASSQFNSLG